MGNLTMTLRQDRRESFSYRAQGPDGQEISGTVNANNQEDALRRLRGLNLQKIELGDEASPPMPHRAAPLNGEDFRVFNQQLAQLTGAGLPVEQGLRLLAAEMRKGSMQRTLETVAQELEGGKSLPQAVAAHRDQFPPLYGELIDAGIRAGNLSGILLNLGNHLTLVRRLQAILWQTMTYPVIIVLGFLGVLYFIMVDLVPKWKPLMAGFSGATFWMPVRGRFGSYQDFEIPAYTRVLFAISDLVSAWPTKLILAAILALALIAIIFMGQTRRRESWAEGLLLHLPVVGGVLRQNLISRWCHAVALGVEAALDLPAAIRLADDATDSRPLRRDGAALIATLSAGQPIGAVHGGHILPATVIAAMEASSERGDLAITLRALSQMYQQQAEIRLGAVQAVLTPAVLILIGLIVGALMVALFAPLLSLLNMF
jgi:type II secretory pathway component PulF